MAKLGKLSMALFFLFLTQISWAGSATPTCKWDLDRIDFSAHIEEQLQKHQSNDPDLERLNFKDILKSSKSKGRTYSNSGVFEVYEVSGQAKYNAEEKLQWISAILVIQQSGCSIQSLNVIL